MKIEIKKERNVYNDTWYRLEVATAVSLTKEEYKTIIDAIEAVSKVLDTKINIEIAAKIAKQKEENVKK